MDLGASGQVYACAGDTSWRATVIFERLVHVAHEERLDSVTCESGQCEKCPMKGVTAILSLRAIKGVCGWPWHMLGTLET
jgi:hypothetical protein